MGSYIIYIIFTFVNKYTFIFSTSPYNHVIYIYVYVEKDKNIQIQNVKGIYKSKIFIYIYKIELSFGHPVPPCLSEFCSHFWSVLYRLVTLMLSAMLPSVYQASPYNSVTVFNVSFWRSYCKGLHWTCCLCFCSRDCFLILHTYIFFLFLKRKNSFLWVEGRKMLERYFPGLYLEQVCLPLSILTFSQCLHGTYHIPLEGKKRDNLS